MPIKLIIQIPCYNEEASLPRALAELPREISGVDIVEWLIIDDGSSDKTVETAINLGVHHVVRHPRNLGLAKAFMSGIEACISLGADIIVNTDADNQYCAADIPGLIAPLLAGECDMVIGARPITSIEEFSWIKKRLQLLGSWMLRVASGTGVADAPSGFRAISRKAAMRMNVFNDYTYTLETIIQAGYNGLSIKSVPVRVNKSIRPSRLVKSISSYVIRSIGTILRILMVYRPLKFFLALGSIPFTLGFAIGVRFVVYYAIGQGDGKVQSLILASLLMSVGVLLFVLALVADLIAVNRRLLEKLESRIRLVEERLPGRRENNR
ncbi:MAG TPA: glycosyltransferase family 2 protein [Kiritimatiellia bacterium]|nr:glycosyltransferase family 2 protein [Kiritimatiellia bacterium]